MLASSQDLSPLQSQCCPRYRAPGAVAELPPAIISTDLYIYNVDGAVYNLATAVSKFPYLGLQVVEMTTSNLARSVCMENGIETLCIGACMDVTLMALHEGPVPLTHGSERGHQTGPRIAG